MIFTQWEMRCSGNHRKSCTCMVGSLESPAGSTWTFFWEKTRRRSGIWVLIQNQLSSFLFHPKPAHFSPFSSQTSSFLSFLIQTSSFWPLSSDGKPKSLQTNEVCWTPVISATAPGENPAIPSLDLCLLPGELGCAIQMWFIRNVQVKNQDVSPKKKKNCIKDLVPEQEKQEWTISKL